jgi:hypothetical protein
MTHLSLDLLKAGVVGRSSSSVCFSRYSLCSGLEALGASRTSGRRRRLGRDDPQILLLQPRFPLDDGTSSSASSMVRTQRASDPSLFEPLHSSRLRDHKPRPPRCASRLPPAPVKRTGGFPATPTSRAGVPAICELPCPAVGCRFVEASRRPVATCPPARGPLETHRNLQQGGRSLGGAQTYRFARSRLVSTFRPCPTLNQTTMQVWDDRKFRINCRCRAGSSSSRSTAPGCLEDGDPEPPVWKRKMMEEPRSTVRFLGAALLESGLHGEALEHLQDAGAWSLTRSCIGSISPPALYRTSGWTSGNPSSANHRRG